MSSKRPSKLPSALPPPLVESVFPPKVTSEADSTAMSMIQLFANGKAALATYVALLPAMGQPLGWERYGAGVLSHLHVITGADFDAQAHLVRRYVITNHSMVHVLEEDGSLAILVEPREVRHW